MEWYWAFALLLGMVMFFLAMGVPVAFAFVATNLIAIIIFAGTSGLIQVADNSTELISRFTLGPVPMFIMMGSLFFHTGLAIKVFDGLDAIFGRLPGRLCYLTVAGGAIFSTLTGFVDGQHGDAGLVDGPGNEPARLQPEDVDGADPRHRRTGDDHPALGARRPARRHRGDRCRAASGRRFPAGIRAGRALCRG